MKGHQRQRRDGRDRSKRRRKVDFTIALRQLQHDLQGTIPAGTSIGKFAFVPHGHELGLELDFTTTQILTKSRILASFARRCTINVKIQPNGNVNCHRLRFPNASLRRAGDSAEAFFSGLTKTIETATG